MRIPIRGRTGAPEGGAAAGLAAGSTLPGLQAMFALHAVQKKPQPSLTMARTISFRLPDELARRVAAHADRWMTASDSDVYRRVIDEWARLQEHPGIRFVDGPTGRRAALVGGPDVWEIVAAARDFDFDRVRLADTYPWLNPERLDSALRYYEAYPDEIDARIEMNARAAQELERELERLGR